MKNFDDEFKKTDNWLDQLLKFGAAFWVVSVVAGLAFWGAVAYVVCHFITKLW